MNKKILKIIDNILFNSAIFCCIIAAAGIVFISYYANNLNVEEWYLWLGIGLLSPLGLFFIGAVIFLAIKEIVVFVKKIKTDPKAKRQFERNKRKFILFLKKNKWFWVFSLTIIAYVIGLGLLITSKVPITQYVGIGYLSAALIYWLILLLINIIGNFRLLYKSKTTETEVSS